MVTQFSPVNAGGYEYDKITAAKSLDKEVQENPKPTNVKHTEAVPDYVMDKKVEKLSETLQNAMLYTKEASKAVAAMILTKKIEVVA